MKLALITLMLGHHTTPRRLLDEPVKSLPLCNAESCPIRNKSTIVNAPGARLCCLAHITTRRDQLVSEHVYRASGRRNYGAPLIHAINV
jgi:hypothetical protein